jgi:hypothetical protein
MKEYIWEKAFSRTTLSVYYNKYSEGLLSVATFIRLIGGEIRGIYHGNDGSVDKAEEGLLLLGENLVPVIYFSYPNAPYISYQDEQKVVEKIIAENNISVLEYINQTDLEHLRKKAFDEYSKSSQIVEWEEYMKHAEKLAEEMDKFANEFNDLKNDPDWQVVVWGYKDEGKLMLTLKHSTIDIHNSTTQKDLPREKRSELFNQGQKIFLEFGEFLKEKYLNL